MEPLEQRTLLAVLPTLTSLTASSALALPGESLTLTAVVTTASGGSTTPTGAVDFIDSATHATLGQASLVNGVATFTTTTLAIGNHSITAHYLGDANCAASNALAGPNSTITTVAGNGTAGFSGDGGLATAAMLNSPAGVAVDAAGNLFIADSSNNRIRKLDLRTGIITTIAGTGTAGYGGDGGPATNAMLGQPGGLAIDADGNLLIADPSNNRVRKVELATGVITTIAGNGTQGDDGDGGSATAAALSVPSCVAVDAEGNLLIGVSRRVRKVDHVTGVINSVAGNGNWGYTGDGGLATAATFSSFLTQITTDSVGNLFISDSMNGCVREVEHSTGIITTVAGRGNGVADGGQATDAAFNFTTGLAVDAAGNLIIAVLHNHRLYTVDLSTGVINTLAGNGALGYAGDGGSAADATFGGTYRVAIDATGSLFIADLPNHCIREILAGVQVLVAPMGGLTPALTVTDAGGTYNGSPFPATVQLAGAFGQPAVSLEGVSPTLMYYAGTDPSGPGSSTAPTVAGVYTVVASFAGSAHYAAAQSTPVTFTIAKAQASVFLAASAEITHAGESVTLTATVSLPAGGTPLGSVEFVDLATHATLGTVNLTGGVATFSTTALAVGNHRLSARYTDENYLGTESSIISTVATLNSPYGLAQDATGSLFAISGNCVYLIDASTGLATLVAGSGAAGYSGDSGPATLAQLNAPRGIAIDAAGNLFIAEVMRVRKVVLATGVITTVAGNGGYGSGGDGGPAIDASLCTPEGLAVGAGKLYIADGFGTRVRAVDLASGLITTVAGGGAEVGDGGQATAAVLHPTGVALDNAGRLLIAEYTRVRAVNLSTGVITTRAGAGDAGADGDGGPATAARFGFLRSLALDDVGNLYIADFSDARVREVNALTGIITTAAGNGITGLGGDGGPAINAQLGGPWGMVVDAAGDLLIAEASSNRIREVQFGVQVIVASTDGVMPVVRVTHSGGTYSGDPLPAVPSVIGVSGKRVDNLEGVSPTVTYYAGSSASGVGSATAPSLAGTYTAVASFAGSVHYATAQSDPFTFTISKAPAIVTMALSSNVALVDEAVTLTATVAGYAGSLATAVTGTVDFFDALTHTALGSATLLGGTANLNTSALAAGKHYIAAVYSGDDNYLAADVPPFVATVVGNGVAGDTGDGGPAAAARLDFPMDVAFDAAGNLFIADDSNNRIRRVDHVTGLITTVAGNGTHGYSGDGGLATEAALRYPTNIAIDAAGDLFITDSGNGRVRKVEMATGIITTVAGNGDWYYSGDGGLATAAGLGDPRGVAVDAAGNLFIAEYWSGRVRRVDHVTGVITTVAGNGDLAYGGDGARATQAAVGRPADVVLDAVGNLFIASGWNNRVFQVDHATGVITTVAGNGGSSNIGDGGLATDASLGSPLGLALDSDGNLLISTSMWIRKVDLTTGLITTVAGSEGYGYRGDGGPARDALFSELYGLAVDAAGTLFVADSGNNCIREIVKGTPLTVVANPLTPTVVISRAGAIYNGAPHPVAATIAGIDGTPGASLEGVELICTYYVGSNVSGAGSITAPTEVGTYTVVASFAGSTHYASIQLAPVTFNITPTPPSMPGLYDPATSTFYLRTANSEGPADISFVYTSIAGSNARPVAGDWDGDGKTTIGLFNPDSSWFYLRNSNDSGAADLAFGYGDPSNKNYVLMMGDWDGDGRDTVGLYDRQSAHWFLRNSNTAGYADVDFGYGEPGSSWTPLVGDWNGDGRDTIGFLDTVNSIYYLRNNNTEGYADYTFGYGEPNTTPSDPWIPVMGDWDGTHTDSIGFYRSASAHWYLRNTNDQGIADINFGFGYPGLLPVVGNWTGLSVQSLLAASDQLSVEGGITASALLTADAPSLMPVLAESLARWAAAGVNLAAPHMVVTDLPGNQLGAALGNTLYLDRDAAGQGWFIDPTPNADEEFAAVSGKRNLQAVDPRAVDRIDLLTVVEHELGHLAGFSDLEPALENLMSGVLTRGVRRTATAGV